MKRVWFLPVVSCTLAATMACGQQSPNPAGPSAVANLGTAAATADGSTLKATAPTPLSPINTTGVTPGQRVVLVVTNATLLYVAGVDLSYRFEVTNASGTVVETTLVASGATTTSRTVGVTLDGNQNYQWRARAEYQALIGPWSAKVSFVAPPPRLAVTNFLAFGDSITQGVVDSPCPATPSGLAPLSVERRALSLMAETLLLKASVNVPTSYPSRLQDLLASRYTTQSPTVTNEGLAGELADDNATLARLRAVLSRTPPQVLLLQEGVNDIDVNSLSYVAPTVAALRGMVREAQGRGIQVLLGTLLPERARACRGYAPGLIPIVNDSIRAMAASEGATLVDLYQVFVGQEGTLLGFDGLHPTVGGYQLIAQTFLDAIRGRFETPSPLSPSSSALVQLSRR